MKKRSTNKVGKQQRAVQKTKGKNATSSRNVPFEDRRFSWMIDFESI
jgi:hypothetical protein